MDPFTHTPIAMVLVGLTGGIGSGKSTVAAIFETLGIPVYDSDAKAKSLMAGDPGLRTKIVDLLGSEAYQEKVLNTSWIAKQVFTDPENLEKLNAIVHPAVYEDLLKWAAEEQQKTVPYLIQESAILFEQDLTARFKYIILVVADEETRIQRVLSRDEVTREHVMKRIDHQWKDEMKIPLSDFVIFNDSSRSLINQVKDIDEMIQSLITND